MKYNLNMPLGEQICDGMRSAHDKFNEFIRHKKGDINLSSFLFYEFCRLKEQELRRTYYMKDVVLYGMVPTKFISSFLELHFIFYQFSNFKNKQVQLKCKASS